MKTYIIAILIGIIFIAGCTTPYTSNVIAPQINEITNNAEPKPVYLKTMLIDNVGKILVDDLGMVLYTKTGEFKSSSCYNICAKNWPPVVVSDSILARDILPGKLDMITRTDGTMQATYNNMPLYYYIADSMAGQISGNGLNGIWSVVITAPIATSQPTPMEPTQTDGYY